MTEHRCSMPTARLQMCSRPARYLYLKGTQVVAAYCAQHHRAGGHSRILRPAPWEYDRAHDLELLGEPRFGITAEEHGRLES